MSNKNHIKSNLYNLGKKEIDLSMPGEVALELLRTEKDRLKKLWVSFDSNSLLPAWNSIKQPILASDFVDLPNTSLCHGKIERIFEKIILTREQYDGLILEARYYPASISKHIAGRKERIAEINEELRQLRQELKANANKDLFFRIKELVRELHCIISFFYSKQRSHLRSYRKSVSTNLVLDFRKKLRQTIQFIFKYLPDFSGCEEEARFKSTTGYKPLFQNLNRKIDVLQQNFFTQCAGLFNGFSTGQVKQQRTAFAAGYL